MAQTETVIHSFPANSSPYARPYEDPTGALYVPTYYGGHGSGTVYEMAEKHGSWKGHIIHKFNGGGGINPAGALIEDPSGVLFGTTRFGGAYGFGTAYSLALANGIWNATDLYDFTGGADGDEPDGDLMLDTTTGAFYGTASSGGGSSGCGTVFELAESGGTWTFTTLYSFQGGSDGCIPEVALHEGTKPGTLLGTTTYGGTANAGTVFELAETNGVWTESVLYTFTGGNDGGNPFDIAIDKVGNVYGVAASGGAYSAGAVFELSNSHRKWQQAVLYGFEGGTDGSDPVGIHLEESTGTLFGTTQSGGTEDAGTVFKLVPNGDSWTESLLHSFGTTEGDGLYPAQRPTEDPRTGVLFGTTVDGGQYGGGTVYTITQ